MVLEGFYLFCNQFSALLKNRIFLFFTILYVDEFLIFYF